MSWQEEFKRLKPQIESALSYNAGTQSLEDIKRKLEDGSFTMWSSKDSVLIIESTTLGGKQYVVIALGGGNLEQIKELVNQVEDNSKKLGFYGVMIICKIGRAHV